MTDQADKLSDREIGKRLRLAREAAELTQKEAADAMQAARTTIVAIEQGQRRVRGDELQKLAALYKTSANAILRREALHLDLIPRFRKLGDSGEGAVEAAAHLLNDLVRAEVELENALGIRRVRNYPPERPILPGDVRAQAEQNAQELRDWLGLGAAPVLDIVSILELQLGVRVYLRRLDGKISGLFAYDNAVGACILLNASHPPERIVQSGGHELGHFVSTRAQPEVLTTGEKFTSREERYANVFGRCFVAPARAVRQRFAEITAGQSHLTRRHVILLASALGLSREGLVRRLEELALVKSGTWDWFEDNGGITDEQAREVLGELPSRDAIAAQAGGLVPPRVALLAGEAWRRELYSEGQLARLLQVNRLELRELLDSVHTEESEANALSH